MQAGTYQTKSTRVCAAEAASPPATAAAHNRTLGGRDGMTLPAHQKTQRAMPAKTSARPMSPVSKASCKGPFSACVISLSSSVPRPLYTG